MSPEICPVCGGEVPSNSSSCPGCGADEKTGWSDSVHAGGLDLPEDEFDYPDFVAREFGGQKPVPRGIHWFWWTIAVLVLIAFVFLWFH